MMKKNTKSVFSLLLCAAGSANAQIDGAWGVETFNADWFGNNGVELTAAEAMNTTFELGIFTGTFMPSSANADLWRDNWEVIESVAGAGAPVPTAQGTYAFGSDAGETPTGGTTSLPVGAKIYICAITITPDVDLGTYRE